MSRPGAHERRYYAKPRNRDNPAHLGLDPAPPWNAGPPPAFSILLPTNGDPPQHLAFPPAPRCLPNSRQISHPWSSGCKIIFGSPAHRRARRDHGFTSVTAHEHCISDLRRHLGTHSGPNAVPASKILKIGRARVVVRRCAVPPWLTDGRGPGCARRTSNENGDPPQHSPLLAQEAVTPPSIWHF